MGKMGKRKKEQSKPQGKQTDITSYFNKVSPAQSTNQVQGSASTAPHRGGGTTRIPEGIRATSSSNKKRRVQRYESDTEDEVGIFHGININNNINYNAINEATQRDMESPPPHSTNRGMGTNRILENISTHSNSKASQEDPFSGYRAPIYNPHQIQQSPPPTYGTANFNNPTQQPSQFSSTYPSSSEDSGQNGHSDKDKGSAEQQNPDIFSSLSEEDWEDIENGNYKWKNSGLDEKYIEEVVGKDKIIFNDTLSQYTSDNKISDNKGFTVDYSNTGAKHGTKLGIRFEFVPNNYYSGNNIKKEIYGTFSPENTVFVSKKLISKKLNSVQHLPQTKESYISTLAQDTNDKLPRYHSEIAALDNITLSADPVNGISKDSFLNTKIKMYRDIANLDARQGNLRVKFYMNNSQFPPCTDVNTESGITCDTYLKNFIQKLAEAYKGVDFRMIVNSPKGKKRYSVGSVRKNRGLYQNKI